MFLYKISFKTILPFACAICVFAFFNVSDVNAQTRRYTLRDCESVLKKCFDEYDHTSGKFNSTDKACLTKGKDCLSVIKTSSSKCNEILDSCFANACSGSTCSDASANEELGKSCLISAGIQYSYGCYANLKAAAMNYASQAVANANAEQQRLKQMEIQAQQAQAQAQAQAAQAQAQAQAEAARVQAESQERIRMMEIQQAEAEAQRQAEERELDRQAQAKANANPNSDVVVRLNELKKTLNYMDASINEAKDAVGYAKYQFKDEGGGNTADVKANEKELMWFKLGKKIKIASYSGEDRNSVFKIDSDIMSSDVDGENNSNIYYTCSKNANTGTVYASLSNYYNYAQNFMSDFEDILLIAKDSPAAMMAIDFTCVDNLQQYVQPLREYINELAPINKTALCKFDTSSLMNAMGGMGGVGSGGLPRSADGRIARLNSGSSGIGGRAGGFNPLSMLASSSDTANMGGTYNTDLMSMDANTDAVAGAKVARAVGYSSDINRALMYCYQNTVNAMKGVLSGTSGNSNNSYNNYYATGTTELIVMTERLTNKDGKSVPAEVTNICSNISDYALSQNIQAQFNGYSTCQNVCVRKSVTDYSSVIGALKNCINLLSSTKSPSSSNGR